MPLDNPRIEDLRRRVQADPASIAFAQLAEEYRRAGQYEEAVRTCRLGLARHPTYLSARVTLGRALIELDALEEAAAELDFVLQAAPENLAAIRGLAEIYHRRRQMPQALEYYRRALALARHDPDLEETVAHLARELGGGAVPPPGLSFEEAQTELISALDRLDVGVGEERRDAVRASGAAAAIARPAQPKTAPAEEGGGRPAGGGPLGEAGPGDAPPAPAPEPARQLFDFDELLAALGEDANRPAPAPVEALLEARGAEAAPAPSGVGAAVGGLTPDDADVPVAAAETAGWPLAAGETGAGESPQGPVEGSNSPAEAEKLERWLAEIMASRGRGGDAAE